MPQVRSQKFWITVSYATLAVLAIADFFTTAESMIFYLIPVAIAAHFVSHRSAMIAAVATTLAWVVAEVGGNDSMHHQQLPLSSLEVRMASLLIFCFIVSRWICTRKEEEQLRHFIYHDLRSPLASVAGGLEMIRDQAKKSKHADIFRCAELGLASSEQMLLLIDGILDTSGIKHGKLKLDTNEFDPLEILWTASNQLKLLADTSNCKVRIKSICRERLALTDFNLSVRVVGNLLHNAIKHGANSTVSMTAEPFHGSQILVRITDRGPGMKGDEASRVFDLGFKSSKSKGSGLGLAFCKQAVEAMGGTIWFESNAGKGTTACFTLPAVEPVATHAVTFTDGLKLAS